MFFKNKKDIKANQRESHIESNQRVYTYYTASRRQIDKFERNNEQRGQQNNKSFFTNLFGSRIIAIMASIITVVLALFLITLSGNPAIKIKGQSGYRPADSYIQGVTDILRSDYRNWFKFSLQANTIEQRIKDEFYEVNGVEVEAPLIGRDVSVLITTEKPFAVMIQDDHPSLVLNNEGRAVADIQDTELETEGLSTLQNNSGIIFEVGSQVFRPFEMQNLTKLEYQLDHQNNNTVSFYVLSETPREIWLKRPGYYIKFSLDDSGGAGVDQQYGAYRVIEKSINQEEIAKPKEYIDVRLADKVYVK